MCLEFLSEALIGSAEVRYFRELVNIDLREDARQIRIPTLVMHARDDQSVPFEAGKELATLVPNARFEVVEGGHREGTASTSETRQIALDFLASLGKQDS